MNDLLREFFELYDSSKVFRKEHKGGRVTIFYGRGHSFVGETKKPENHNQPFSL